MVCDKTIYGSIKINIHAYRNNLHKHNCAIFLGSLFVSCISLLSTVVFGRALEIAIDARRRRRVDAIATAKRLE